MVGGRRSRSSCSIIAWLSLTAAVPLFGGCGGTAVSEHETVLNREQTFIASVDAAGGHAKKKFFRLYGKEGDAWLIDLHGAKIDDRIIDLICALPLNSITPYVAELDLSESTITDAQLLKLDDAKVGRTVMVLNLNHTEITDKSLEMLKNFYCLDKLGLKGTKISREAIQRFRRSQQANPNVQSPFRNGPKVER
ncbi:MAG: hypothetical protein ACT4QC_15845 [Planctomycetaceae bacterium]